MFHAYRRRRFQGFATLLLSGLSFVAVIYAAVPDPVRSGLSVMKPVASPRASVCWS